jgi:hypothetical protein
VVISGYSRILHPKKTYLLNYRFLKSKINEFYLELRVLTKNVTVMLLIVLAEAALG